MSINFAGYSTSTSVLLPISYLHYPLGIEFLLVLSYNLTLHRTYPFAPLGHNTIVSYRQVLVEIPQVFV